MSAIRPLSAALAVATLLLPAGARAFAVFQGLGATPAQVLQSAARWSSSTGLDDGLQVGVDPGLAAALAAPGEDPALVQQAVEAGILAWGADSPVLDLEVLLDGSGNREINLFALPGSDPIFAGTGFFGFAQPQVEWVASRPLTNGQAFAGYVITGADVFLNIDQFGFLAALPLDLRRDVLTRVTMHEVGHALGLGHPNANNPFGALPNYDTDGDPTNVLVIDPLDPFGALIESAATDLEAIMSNGPCGIPPTLCAAASFTALRNDDRGGRDALYPIPEPGSGALVAAGCAALSGRRRRGRSGGPALR